MKKETEKEKDSFYAEGTLSVLSVLKAESRPVYRVLYSSDKNIHSDRRALRIASICRARGIPFERCAPEFVEEHAVGTTHAGMLAEVGERILVDLDEMFSHHN